MFLHRVDVAHRIHRYPLERTNEFRAQLVEHAAGFGQIEYALRGDVGAGDHARFFTIDRNDHHHDAVVGERLAIAQHRLTDVADARSIDEDVAAVRAADFVA